MKQWSDVVPQARQVVSGVRSCRAVRRNVLEDEPSSESEVDWAEMALSVLTALLTEADILNPDDVGDPKYYEDWYDMNCAFLLECGFHIEMPRWLGMCAEYPWGSN